MPNILSKLFRRKKAGAVDAATSKDKGRKGKKGKIQKNVIQKADPAKTISPVRSDEEGLINRNNSLSNTSLTGRGSNGSAEKESTAAVESRSPENQRVVSPRSQTSRSAAMTNDNMWRMEEPKLHVMPSHDENLDHSNAPAPISPRLSFQQLQQFESQQRRSPPSNQISHQPLFHMSSDIPRHQAEAMDDMNRSDASSSSFNLSTDAEDSEYEQVKRLGYVPREPLPGPYANSSTLDTSNFSAISSPTAYTTDDERLFPALQTDDEMTQATAQSLKSAAKQPQGLLVPLSTPDDEPGRIQIYPARNETDDDMRAWGITTQQPNQNSSRSAASDQQFGFQNSVTPTNSTTNGRATPGPSRNFTSPKSSSPASGDFSSNNDFANFADFSNFGDTNFGDNHFETFDNDIQQWNDNPNRVENKRSPTGQRGDMNGFGNFGGHMPSSASETQHDASLSELLAQAKGKRRSGRKSLTKHSSSSVNSAPAITSQYLRQHHNLRSYSGYGDREREGSRASADATSVSDIIQSLEATNQSRMKSGASSRHSSHRSLGEGGVARSAKELFREKRRKERLSSSSRGLHRSRSSEHSSSENSENEASESWLFDEVTGALGPRGIAADLESLSGRSRNSNKSSGNKSHKSHRSHRSHRSRRSHRRHKSTSNASVDSHGSRTSRNSRNSRYSHRSTKSFLSQMSEQSRSVANDLLRLEMQLAMVGSQENRDDVPARATASVGGSVGGASRTNRTSRKQVNGHRSHSHSSSSFARRSKMTVIAPPGKLGIILANKADSKGTVVSGVRTSSILAEKISPGDRIIAIDGEDVSRMTVSEITTIMARKADFERTLTVLTTPKHVTTMGSESLPRSPTNKSSTEHFDNGFQYRR